MIQVSNLRYAYGQGDFQLNIPDLRVETGKCIAVVGPSGSGKSTLLSLLAGIHVPNAGQILIDDFDLSQLKSAERRSFRARRVGFIFQEFELLEYLTIAENIRLPFLVNSELSFGKQHQERLLQLVEQTRIQDKLNRKPAQLSQGERQRVAICRALITDPRVVLADEPTGSLDPRTAIEITQLLIGQIRNTEAALVMVTHDHSLLPMFDMVYDLAALHAPQPSRSTR